MADQLSATKRKNLLAGWAADALGAVDSFARAPFGYSNPPVQAISNLLGVPGLQRTLDRVSYGEPLTTGKGQATRLRDDTVDALGFVPMSPKAALAVASNGLAGGAEKAIFAGVKAKNAPLNMLERAQALEASGADPRKVWADTGWMKGGDGKWRFEIDDSGAKLNRTRTTNPENFIDLFDEAAGRSTGVSMGNALDHAALYQAYPDTQALRFTVGGKEGGSLSGNTVRISDPWDAAIGAPGSNPESTTLHELQHAIQEREGFAKGGSPEMFAKDSLPLAVNNQRLLDDIAKSGAVDFGSFYEGGRFGDLQTAADAYAKARGIPIDQAYDAAGAFWQYGGEQGGLRGLQDRISRAQSEVDNAFTSPHEKYQRLAGEAEARAVQARMNMTPEQRRATFPLDSYDVDIANLIYRMDSNGPALATVWHGTPHKFDKFDSSKIGTGEGAQAYGHGLYLAESPEVGQQYARMNLTGPANVAHVAARDGGDAMAALKMTYPGMPKAWYESAIEKGKDAGNLYKVDLPDEAIARMLDWDKPLSQQSADFLKTGPYNKALLDAYELGKTHRAQAGGIKPGSAFYDGMRDLSFTDKLAANPVLDAFYNAGASGHDIPVYTKGMRYGDAPKSGFSRNYADDINERGVSMARVDHPEFENNWENTVSAMFIKSDRPEKTYEGFALRGPLGSDGEPLMVGLREPMTGQSFYQALVKQMGSDSAATAELRRRGIPGIRYLDGGSRGAGQGTSNFVVFPGEENMLQILERNGQPVAQVAPSFNYPQADALETARKNAVSMLGLPEDNTAADRAAALGFTDVLHGSSSDISQVKTQGRRYVDPFYVTEDAGDASKAFANSFAETKPELGAPAVYPLKIRSSSVVDTRNGVPQALSDAAESAYSELRIGDKGLPTWGGVNNWATAARDAGIKGVILEERPSVNSIAVFDPAIIRSRFAAFDPARVNENDLLGGVDADLLKWLAGGSAAALGGSYLLKGDK